MLIHSITALVGTLLLGIAAGYAVLTVVAALAWRISSIRRPMPTLRPAVTLLKPLCGAEPELYENLRSFCLQDYPSFQIVFGARDVSDPAVGIAQRLVREFPALPIEIVVDAAQQGPNRKVSNLINMLPRARHDMLIIADSDTRVGADYLSIVAAPLLDQKNGLVTCLHRIIPVGGVWSRLASMYVNDWYMPTVMLAWLFGHRGYVSGQTIGLTRNTLNAMGGFQAIVNYLADDYQLGKEVRRLGLRIALASCTLDTLQSEPSAGALLGHELRWMRTIRTLAPGSFPLLFVSFTLPLLAAGLALTAAQPEFLPLSLLCVVIVSRIGVSGLVRLSQRRIPLRDLWLLPLRDLLLCWTWLRALFASRLRWRGQEFEVDRQGIMHSTL